VPLGEATAPADASERGLIESRPRPRAQPLIDFGLEELSVELVPEDEGERYFAAERAAEVAERVSTVVANAVSLVLILSMLGDLLGVNVFELAWRAITTPWVIPVELITAYYPVWYSMYWALFVIMVADYAVYFRYSTMKKMPPPSYAKYLSLVAFLLSFWLALLFRTLTLTVVAVFSAMALVYTLRK